MCIQIIAHYGGPTMENLNYRFYILMVLPPMIAICSIRSLRYLSPCSISKYTSRYVVGYPQPTSIFLPNLISFFKKFIFNNNNDLKKFQLPMYVSLWVLALSFITFSILYLTQAVYHGYAQWAKIGKKVKFIEAALFVANAQALRGTY